MATGTATIEITITGFDRLVYEIRRCERAIRGLADAFWLLEQRGRVWFWRGLIGEERRVNPMVWISHGTSRWWYVGRATGEILAGMVR